MRGPERHAGESCRAVWRVARCVLLPVLFLAPAQAEEPWAPKAWLGVTLGSPERPPTEIGSPEGERLEPAADGVLVTGVAKGSPADEAGLRAGDIVRAVNGEPVGSPDLLIRAVGGLEPGSWVEIALTRRESEKTLDVRLDRRPPGSARLDIKRGWSGIVPVDVPGQLQEFWGGEDGAGVLVGAVTPGSPAEVAGLMPGDLVVEVDGEPVSAVHELLRSIVGGGVGNELELRVSRQGTFFEAEMQLAEQPPPDELERLGEKNLSERRRGRRSGR